MSQKYPCPAGREDDCGYPACAHDRQCELAASTCSAYLCVQGGTNRELSDRVNAAIQDGFQPYGHPISHCGYIVQSMTRTEQNQTGQEREASSDPDCSK